MLRVYRGNPNQYLVKILFTSSYTRLRLLSSSTAWREAASSASTRDLLKADSVASSASTLERLSALYVAAFDTANSASILDRLRALSVAISAYILDLLKAFSVAIRDAAT